jgi:RHS repeat-associated protein
MPETINPVPKFFRSAAYTYDELGRLSSALTTGSTGTGGYAQWGLSFSYDRYGNLLKEQSTAGSVGTTCLAVSTSTNQVTGTCALPSLSTYNYDANGNMLKDGANTLTYDAENRTTNAAQSGSSVADYVYDGNGLRVKKCVPSCSSSTTTTRYIYSGSSVIAEYENGAAPTAPTREYLYAGGLKVATVTGSTPMYHLRDHLSVRVNTDSSGMLIGEQGHYPFGDNWYLNSTTTKEMFTTYERDPETGTGSAGTGNDYAMARYYPNRLGRFSSIDPLSGNTRNPQSLNRYAYVTNDPINLMDPTGMSEATAICGNTPSSNDPNPAVSNGFSGNLTCGGANPTQDGGGGGINFGDDGSLLWWSDPSDSNYPTFSSSIISGFILGPQAEPEERPSGCDKPGDPTFFDCAPESPQMPANLVPETDPKYWDPFNSGFAAAKAALAKRSCAKLFGGKGADALDATQYRFVTLPSPKQWAQTQQGGSTVFINPQGAFMNFATIVGNTKLYGRTWTADSIRALIILHELGHELNILQADGNNETLSGQNNQTVADACF